jgi:SAM-dependent methyltransferase
MLDFLLIFLVILSLIFAIWISSCIFGAPFQPSSNKALKEMLELAGVKRGGMLELAGLQEMQNSLVVLRRRFRVADLGSGDGKIVIEFAKKGAEAHGFEINPLLVLISRRRIKNMHLQKRAFIHWKNFMKTNLSKFNIITSFQISYIMPNLENKLKKELRKGARVISNTWKFPNWKPRKKIGHVYLYVK